MLLRGLNKLLGLPEARVTRLAQEGPSGLAWGDQGLPGAAALA